MKRILNYAIVLYILFLLPAIAIAQDGFGDPNGDVPIDGGLSLLVAAGVGYGAKQLKAHKKKNQSIN